jgi:hypothetical protein
MKRTIRIVLAGVLMALGVCLSQGSVQAQFGNPFAAYYQNQLNQQAWAGQQAFVGQAGLANVYSPFAGGNPYSPAGLGGNPYTPSLGTGLLNSLGYSPYALSPGVGYGVSLMGQAEVMKSYGTVITSQEQARSLREKANQDKLDTQKKAFDLAMYIKANTPTYTQEQAAIAKQTLKRIQSLSLPGEVANGKSLNYLLDDLRKFPNKKIALEALPISESQLTRVNVTKSDYGVGLLRDGNRLNWPIALRNLMTNNKRQDLDKQIKAIVEDAYRGRLDANALKDVRNEMEKITSELVSKCNEIPGPQYVDAKGFLFDFDRSVKALEKGEARVQADFQKFIDGGKSIQQVVDYMVNNGLKFGPAMAEDEAAYRTVHAMLSRFDIEMNTAMGTDER